MNLKTLLFLSATLLGFACSSDSTISTPTLDAGKDLQIDTTNEPDTSIFPDADISDIGKGEADVNISDADTGAGDLFPNGLLCPTLSLCSTFEADPSRVPFPETTGGTLRDGLYRAVQGTNIPYGLAISGGNYALIFENLSVSYGDIKVEGDTFITSRHTVCAPDIENNDASLLLEDTTFFATDGIELITYSGCDSADPNQCSSPTRLVRVNSLCDGLDQLSCPSGDCQCETFTEGVIPPRPENGCIF